MTREMCDTAVTKVRFDRVQFISRAELSVSHDWIHRSHYLTAHKRIHGRHWSPCTVCRQCRRPADVISRAVYEKHTGSGEKLCLFFYIKFTCLIAAGCNFSSTCKKLKIYKTFSVKAYRVFQPWYIIKIGGDVTHGSVIKKMNRKLPRTRLHEVSFRKKKRS